MTDIDIKDSSTWPLLLTVEHIAAIWQLSIATVNRKVSDGGFIPMPIENSQPRRWRKSHVEKFIFGDRTLRKVG